VILRHHTKTVNEKSYMQNKATPSPESNTYPLEMFVSHLHVVGEPGVNQSTIAIIFTATLVNYCSDRLATPQNRGAMIP
jgi:hypothetical protein